MPTLEITTPRLNLSDKQNLARQLTDAFSEATGVEKNLVAIRFSEYGPGEFSVGGELCTLESEQPYVHVRVFCSRLKKSMKEQMIRTLHEQFTHSAKRADWKVVIHIVEHPYDNIGVCGKMQSQRDERYAQGGFYYELPSD